MKKIIIIILFVAVAGIAAYAYFGRTKKSPYDYVVAERNGIVQEISVAGKVKPAQSVDLAFEKSGRVAGVLADVGDKVEAGQIMARLDSGELSSQLLQAEANLEIERAKLEEMRKGARPEEIKITETQAESAQTAVEESRKNLIDKLRDAYAKSDDAVRNQADNLFINPQTASLQLKLPILDGSLRNKVEQSRFQIESDLNKWQNSINRLTTLSDLGPYLKEAKNNLGQIFELLNNLALAVNTTKANGISQTTLDIYKTYVSTARTNLNAAITALTAAEEKLKTSQSNLALAENELALKRAGTAPEQIAAQEARIKASEANVQNYQAQIAKTILRSPIAGTITKQNAKAGEIISANTPVISVISSAKLEIEADIYEEDIVRIKVGNPVDIKIVAFPQKTYKGKVISINPAEKIINEVVYYEVTANFEEIPEEVKPGMTVDIIIRVASKENILIVPRGAVKKMDNKTIINVFKNGEIEEREITIGLKGNDFFEVISGLEEGEQVVTGKK